MDGGMSTVSIPWAEGSGNIVVTSEGGTTTVASDVANESVDRSQTITFKTTKGEPVCTAARVVNQSGLRRALADSASLPLRCGDGLTLTVLK